MTSGKTKITIQNIDATQAMTYNDACSTLRGIGEYLTLEDKWLEWTFNIDVAGVWLGQGQVVKSLAAADADNSSISVASALVAAVPVVSSSVAIG